MLKTIHATFDGSVLRPETDLALEPNTRVRLTLEVLPPSSLPLSFLTTARNLELSGPPDWSEKLDDYLYGEVD